MVAGGGRAAVRADHAARRVDLELGGAAGRAAAERQELPAPVDELPPPGPQEGAHLQARARHHRLPPEIPRQQVINVIRIPIAVILLLD